MDDITRVPEPATAVAGLTTLVFGPRLDDIARRAQSLRAGRVGATVSTCQGNAEQLAGALARNRPDLLLLDMPDADHQTLARVENIEHLYPEMRCLLLCNDHSPEFLKHAMRAGVRDVLSVDADVDMLRGVVDRSLNKRGETVARRGKVLAFISCNGGGSGATFLATNLACELAAAQDKKVIVIDLNLQWGDAALFISHKKPVSTLADVVSQIKRVDATFLAACLVNVNDSVGVLAAPEDPVQALDVKPEHVDALLRIARQEYDFIVLDVGGVLDAISVRALDQADLIFPVMQTSVPFIRDAQRLFKALAALEYPVTKIRLLVNRFQKGGDITLADLELAVGVSVAQTFPNDYSVVTDSINQGVPVIDVARHSAIARSLQQFALTLEPTHKVKPRSWMARLLHLA
jgi:pilus assembly protein CpaE